MLAILLSMLLIWDGVKIVKSDAQWRAQLGRERYCVMRKKATEPSYSGLYLNWQGKGAYRCAACSLALFHSEAKFDAKNGWPAFEKPLVQQHVWIKEDRSMIFLRYEVLCRGCDSHLGHVFRTGDFFRYTINSITLEFEE